jgi:hypothetical protein
VPLFKRRQVQPVDDPRRALYVYLANDGAIFVVRGKTGEQLWTDRQGLGRELERTQEEGGRLIYGREAGSEEPPPHIEETFRQILEYGLPIQLLEEPHPEAIVPPERRRNILRDGS